MSSKSPVNQPKHVLNPADKNDHFEIFKRLEEISDQNRNSFCELIEYTYKTRKERKM